MKTPVFDIDHRYTPPIYVAALFLLSAYCFGSLTDHLFFTHDLDIVRDFDRLNLNPSYFFSSEKATAGGRLVDEFIFWVTYGIWGADPQLYHLLAITLHVLASLILAHSYYRLGADLELSLLAGLLFLLNIAHIQVVHWIAALEYSVATIVAVTAVCLYQSYAAALSVGRLTAFYAVAVIGVFTHSAGVMIGPICLY